jgi:hypothetical protein
LPVAPVPAVSVITPVVESHAALTRFALLLDTL